MIFTAFQDIVNSGKKYKIIYADPPWQYRNFSNAGDPSGIRKLGFSKYSITPYNGMSLAEIQALPVCEIADRDSILFMWVTYPNLQDSFSVLESWGFKYKTVAFTWVKRNKSGFGWYFGLGNYTRANAEICLLATRGKGVKVINRGVEQIIDTPITEHSKKPAIARQRILKLIGDLPRIELFSRTLVNGWDVFGNDGKLNLLPIENYLLAERHE